LDIIGPEGPSSSANGAFAFCTLTTVTIPDNVATIGSEASYYCIYLETITIGNGVISIGDRDFYCCWGLESVTIPDSVTMIGGEAFAFCDGLTSVKMGNGVTTIGNHGFAKCYALTSVTIPANVTSVGIGAFSDCDSLASIDVDPNNPNYASIDGALYNKECTVLIQCPGGRGGEYTIPDDVERMGDEAFLGCEGLTSIIIPGSVTVIGDYAFYYRPSLRAMVFHGDAPTIGSYWMEGYGSGLMVYHYEGATGFDGPDWEELPLRMIPSPSIVITGPQTDEYISTSRVVVKWTSQNATRTEISIDGMGWEEAHGNGREVTLADGPRLIKVRVTDGFGRTNETSVTFTIDTIAPELSIVSTRDGAYIDSGDVLVEYSATDDGSGVAYYRCRIDGSDWSASTTDLSHVFDGLSDGIHVVEVRAFDRAGNHAEVYVTFTVDTVAPELNIISPGDGDILDSSDAKVEWSATDVTSGLKEFMYQLDDGPWTSTDMVNGTELVGLSDGTHALRVRAYDTAENVAETNVTFTVATPSPPGRGHDNVPLVISIGGMIGIATALGALLPSRRP
jgi:hypothetical protein